MPRDGLNLCTPNAAVLAADARVQQHGVCDEGVILLVGVMWEQLHKDLAQHIHEAREWLETPEFAVMVNVCGGNPETARERLIDDYWPVSA